MVCNARTADFHKTGNARAASQLVDNMLGGVGETVVISLANLALDFAINGNAKEIQSKLTLPSLPATIQFNNQPVHGHHQGMRAMSEGKRTWGSLGTLRFTIEASGEGKFVSDEVMFEGQFYRGKFHDTTGRAVASFGTTGRYMGSFEDGHLSGYGVLLRLIGAELIKVFEGTWKHSKPWTGKVFDISGNVMSSVMDGVTIGLFTAEGPGNPRPAAVASESVAPIAPAGASQPAESNAAPDELVVAESTAKPSPKPKSPLLRVSRRTQVLPDTPDPDTEGSMILEVRPTVTALSAPALDEHARVQALIQSKLANPHKLMSVDEDMALMKHCFDQGKANARQTAGETAIMVVGNTGAGKSTFLNFLAGCTMESKSAMSVGAVCLDDVVVVKPVSEGGRRDELAKIGHGKTSQTFLPNVLIDEVTGLCFCDCPGFMDNRGAEINIANAVNLITTLSHAKEVKVIILVSYDTMKADRGGGFTNLLSVCTNLFGSVDKLKNHLNCVLIGCTGCDPKHTLDKLKAFLAHEAPPIVAALVQRLFLVDVLASHEGWWDREECLAQIRSMPAIPRPADVFHTVLLASDEKKLLDMGMEMTIRIENSLNKGDYVACHELYRTLELLSVIKHIAVERIVRDCYLAICKHFMKEASVLKEHCHMSAFPEAKQVLLRLQSAAAVFHGDEWAEVLRLDQLQSFLSTSQSRHVQQMQRDEALKLQLQQAGNQIDDLRAALDAQKREGIRKERELTERLDAMKQGLAEQLEASNAMFAEAQKNLQDELAARLLVKDEETKQATELRQQDVIDRLMMEKQAIEENFKRQLEISKRKYEKDMEEQKAKEQSLLSYQQSALENARKEREAAENRSRELAAAQTKALEDARKSLEEAGQKQKPQQSASRAAELASEVDLYDIACNGNVDVLLELQKLNALASIVDINQQYFFSPDDDTKGQDMTALSIACCQKRADVVEVLLKIPKIDVNVQTEDGRTAFIWACRGGQSALVQILLADRRVNVNVQDTDGRTALCHAGNKGRTSVVNTLLAAKRVDVNIRDKHERTALICASRNGQSSTVQAFFADSRVDVNAEDTDGRTAFQVACRYGHISTVKSLLDTRNVEVNTQDSNGCTALILASQHGHTAVVQLLVAERKVKVNTQSTNGSTALMRASMNGYSGTVEALLTARGIDVNLQNKNGETALSLSSMEEIKCILRAKGAVEY